MGLLDMACRGCLCLLQCSAQLPCGAAPCAGWQEEDEISLANHLVPACFSLCIPDQWGGRVWATIMVHAASWVQTVKLATVYVQPLYRANPGLAQIMRQLLPMLVTEPPRVWQ